MKIHSYGNDYVFQKSLRVPEVQPEPEKTEDHVADQIHTGGEVPVAVASQEEQLPLPRKLSKKEKKDGGHQA